MNRRVGFILFVLGLSLFLVANDAYARNKQVIPSTGSVGASTGLPVPRFVSLRSESVYMRAGPGTRYPVKWIYQRKGYPVQVIQEFDIWRKIKDIDGEEGWVHQSLLSSGRHLLVTGDVPVTMYKSHDTSSRAVAQLEPGVVAKFNECADDWCKVSASGYDGWLLKSSLWGVYEHEESE